jgi:hypothetical protein
MAGTAHLHGLVRHVGKPTSGRFVYKTRDGGGWYWQCDLHDDEDAENGGPVVKTMQEAFAGALRHAETCKPYWEEP